MSRDPSPLSFSLAVPLLMLAAVLLPVAAGCGGGDSGDATANRTKYAPATDDDGPSGAENEEQPAPSADTQGSSSSPASPATPQVQANAGAQRPSQASNNAAIPGQANPAAAPPVSYEVPKGGPPELFAYIEQLNGQLDTLIDQRNASARQTQPTDAIEAEVQKNLDAQIAAAEKILATKPQEETRVEAVSAKARAYQAKFQMQFPGAEEALNGIIEDLANDPNADLQTAAVIYRLTVPMVKLQTGQTEDPASLLSALDTYLAEIKSKDAATFSVAIESIRSLQMTGHMDEAITAMRTVSEAFQGSEEERVAIQSLALGQQAGQYLEYSGRVEEAQEAYKYLQASIANLTNAEVKQELEQGLANAQKRVGLIGQEVKVENMVDLEGKPIDWADFKGKVVLLDFWATWCGPCIAEIPNIAETYAAYKDEGFEVIGVNIDDDIEKVRGFVEQEKSPWTIAVPADPAQRAENPLAKELGVDAIPFMLLVNREGKVAAIHTRGPRLEIEVRKLLNLGEEGKTPAAKEDPADAPKEAPAKDNAPAKESANEVELEGPELNLPPSPTDDEQGETEDGAPDAAQSRSRQIERKYYVVFEDDGRAEQAADSPSEPSGSEPSATVKPVRNPYLADADLSPLELVEYLLDMEDKPEVIQQREGFSEAMVEAADRILAADKASAKHQILAALVKFSRLHDKASFGDEKADAALAAFVEQMKDDPREKIAAEVKFLQLERRALDSQKLTAEAIETLLAELKRYFEEHRGMLGKKHLRIASATIGAINQLDDGDVREKHFHAFGSLFASSSDKELARYGKRLVSESPASSLVGKTLELNGATELGTPFDWQSYRGKVVVVDFWATWCGPCRRATPAVKTFYEQHREKGLEVVGVNLDRDHEALAQYLDENKIAWPNLVGEDGQRLAETYNVRGIPTFMLVNRDGKVVEVGHSFEALQPKIEELLKAS